RKFVRFLDEKIKGAQAPDAAAPDYNAFDCTADGVRTVKAEPRNETGETSENLDFSHVKNVLSRLEPAVLSYSDRRQIYDLETALYAAERGGVSPETRSKINEGLGNLLKIMAKHGI
ncbi:MAG: hypothetical protein J6Y43_06440, partial [Clostridia bacterium]|nr:hypothetical protein [Clostridia bacterium]